MVHYEESGRPKGRLGFVQQIWICCNCCKSEFLVLERPLHPWAAVVRTVQELLGRWQFGSHWVSVILLQMPSNERVWAFYQIEHGADKSPTGTPISISQLLMPIRVHALQDADGALQLEVARSITYSAIVQEEKAQHHAFMDEHETLTNPSR